jgi:hypothetical protein
MYWSQQNKRVCGVENLGISINVLISLVLNSKACN